MKERGRRLKKRGGVEKAFRQNSTCNGPKEERAIEVLKQLKEHENISKGDNKVTEVGEKGTRAGKALKVSVKSPEAKCARNLLKQRRGTISFFKRTMLAVL